MQTPKDVDVVSVFITSDSAVKFDYIGRVLPDGTVALPATLAVVEPDSPDAQIRIRITAFQGQKARVLRDVVTKVPHQRTSLLRLPLNLLDDGRVTGMLPAQYLPGGASGVPDGDSSFDPIGDPQAMITPTCDFTQNLTSVNGECVDMNVDSAKLPDYHQADVYGAGGIQPNGAPATCFDVATCFATATPVTGLSMTQCSFPLPSGVDPSTLNLALVTPQTGTYVSQGKYFVPLVDDPSDGWTVQGSTVKMIGGICINMMATGSQLYMSQSACPARTLAAPVCQPTTNAQVADAGTGPAVDAGTDSGAIADGSTDAVVPDSGSCPKGEILCQGACVAAGACGPVDSGTQLDAGRDASAGCASDAQCSAVTPFCNTTTGICVQCLSTANCPSGQTCNLATSTCAGGLSDSGTDGTTEAGDASFDAPGG